MQVSLNEAFTAIRAIGHEVTFFLKGQPGIGKSAILGMLADALPEYLPAYIDCSTLDLGDLAMPVIDRDLMVTNYAPNARFRLHRGQTRPVIIMLDELSKAPKPVINMTLPIINDRRLGDVPLPAGSIVLATGNLDTDGVGDNIPAHAHNRMTMADVRNHTDKEWIKWAMGAAVRPEVLNFVRECPEVMDRYDDPQAKDNPYIFNPLRGQTRAYCSPRSLVRASHILGQRDVLGDSLLALLAGTIGEPAARMLEAQVHLRDQLPSRDAVLSSPTSAKLPHSPSAYFMMATILSHAFSAEHADAIVTYVKRWDQFEATQYFVSAVACSPKNVVVAYKNRSFTELASKCGEYWS